MIKPNFSSDAESQHIRIRLSPCAPKTLGRHDFLHSTEISNVQVAYEMLKNIFMKQTN